MATLYIKKYQMKNTKMPAVNNKWFGRVVHQGTLGTEELAEHIMEHGSVYTDDVVLGVTRKLMRCIAEQLEAGYKVKLDGIGTLYVTAKSTGVDAPEEFDTSKNITGLRVRFLGDQTPDSLYSKAGLKRCRMSTNLAKFGTAVGDENGGGNSGGNGGGDNTVVTEP